MIVIRDQQMQAFAAHQDKVFVARLARLARAQFGAALGATCDVSLHDLAARCVGRARALGFRTESAFGEFLTHAIFAGERFDLHPLVAPLLSSPAVPVEMRFMLMRATLGVADWQLIRSATAEAT